MRRPYAARGFVAAHFEQRFTWLKVPAACDSYAERLARSYWPPFWT